VVIQGVLQLTGLLNGRTADSGNTWQGHDSPTSVGYLAKYVMHVFRAVGSFLEGPATLKRKERANKKECAVTQGRGWNGWKYVERWREGRRSVMLSNGS
jgi:hypothetical protein